MKRIYLLCNWLVFGQTMRLSFSRNIEGEGREGKHPTNISSEVLGNCTGPWAKTEHRCAVVIAHLVLTCLC